MQIVFLLKECLPDGWACLQRHPAPHCNICLNITVKWCNGKRDESALASTISSIAAATVSWLAHTWRHAWYIHNHSSTALSYATFHVNWTTGGRQTCLVAWLWQDGLSVPGGITVSQSFDLDVQQFWVLSVFGWQNVALVLQKHKQYLRGNQGGCGDSEQLIKKYGKLLECSGFTKTETASGHVCVRGTGNGERERERERPCSYSCCADSCSDQGDRSGARMLPILLLTTKIELIRQCLIHYPRAHGLCVCVHTRSRSILCFVCKCVQSDYFGLLRNIAFQWHYRRATYSAAILTQST